MFGYLVDTISNPPDVHEVRRQILLMRLKVIPLLNTHKSCIKDNLGIVLTPVFNGKIWNIIKTFVYK